jgi:hypothetical protein
VSLSLSNRLRFHETSPRIPSSLGVLEIRESSPLGLPTYALNPEMLIGTDVRYGSARGAILDAVVTTLAKADPYFPFPSADRASTLWSLSSDDHAEKPWNDIGAQDVFRSLGRAVTLQAPRLVLLTRRRHPVVEGNDEQLSI